jgi:recombination protein RecA
VQESRAKALQSAITAIEKAFGKGAIMRLGDNHGMAVERIPTGSLGLDIALGGGLPVGRITEIYGPESSGKTTVALSVIACAQRAGLQCAFIDAEHALDPRYAQQLGVDIGELLISQPDTGEQALEICDALVPKNELEGEICLGASRRARRRQRQGRGDHHRAGYQSESGQEQGLAAVPPGAVPVAVRRRHLP